MLYFATRVRWWSSKKDTQVQLTERAIGSILSGPRPYMAWTRREVKTHVLSSCTMGFSTPLCLSTPAHSCLSHTGLTWICPHKTGMFHFDHHLINTYTCGYSLSIILTFYATLRINTKLDRWKSPNLALSANDWPVETWTFFALSFKARHVSLKAVSLKAGQVDKQAMWYLRGPTPPYYVNHNCSQIYQFFFIGRYCAL